LSKSLAAICWQSQKLLILQSDVLRFSMVLLAQTAHRLRRAKAPEGWRTPRRFANFQRVTRVRELLDCGSLLPLFQF
jgi:hypothetical protein